MPRVRVTSRRRPRLKVVSSGSDHAPHSVAFGPVPLASLMHHPSIRVDVWTPEEWQALHPQERPEGTTVIPGTGGLIISVEACSNEERLDIWDRNEQLRELGEPAPRKRRRPADD